MADNYTQTSLAVTNLTPEEAAWIHEEAARRRASADENPDQDDPSWPLADTFRLAAEHGVPWTAGQDAGRGAELWIAGQEFCYPERIADFLQAFLRRWRPTAHLGFAWASTCSKPRLDEFGGGAYFVTAKKIRWMNAWDWLGDQAPRRKPRKAKRPKTRRTR